MQKISRLLIFLIFITAFVSFFRLGSVRLFDIDEAVFAEATKEMVTSGDWITPTYNGVNRYDKPIIFYWVMAVSYKLFGANEFAARFPSALLACLTSIAIFFFVKCFYDEKRALYSSLSFVLSLYFFIYSHAAVTDMTLTFFITLSLFSFYLYVADKKTLYSKRNLYIYGFYAFSSAAFLTKGLIGIIFPFGTALIYCIIRKESRTIIELIKLKAILVFVLISAPWFTAESLLNGREFFQQFFIKHHFMRYTGINSGHSGPFYYYLPVLIIGLFPWISFLPSGIRNVFKEKNSLELLSLVWLAFIFVFFSFSTTKLPNYILPSIPAVSLLISSGMSVQDSWKRYEHLVLSLLSILFTAGFLIATKYLPNIVPFDTNWTFLLAAVTFSICILSITAFITQKFFFRYLSIFMAVFLIIISLKVLPLAEKHLQDTLYQYSIYAKNTLAGNGELITYKINKPSVVFYSGHRIIEAGNTGELSVLAESPGRKIVISKAKDAGTLQDIGFIPLKNDGKYALAEKR